MNPITARLLSQQLICPIFEDPSEVVSWFGAIQAQDYRAMRWAVTSRTRKPSFKAFQQAFDEGNIIRAHLLRCTWQLVSAEDFGWMRLLCYDKALATMNAWMGGYYRLIREKQLETPEARKAYFADKPVGQMTAQDPAVFGEILKFLN